MDPNPQGFPLRDTEFKQISVVGDPQYLPMDIRTYPALRDPTAEEFHSLAAHKLDVAAELMCSNRAFFVPHHPLAVKDPLRPGPNEPQMSETFVWVNHLGKELPACLSSST